MGMRKRLRRQLRSAGVAHPGKVAGELLAAGWRDRMKRPKNQQVTVVPALSPLMQTPLTQLKDHRSMPVDHAKTRYLA